MRTVEAQVMSNIYEETWAVLELHFLTRPHLIERAQAELAQCFDSLLADGRDPHALKDLACRAIQIKYGPAPPARIKGRTPPLRQSA